jgi:predicted anti-sigma-YlaC factor YlaD
MNCLTIDRLYAYLDGDLSPVEKKEADRHFASCESCRIALAARKCLAETAASLPAFEIPDDFSAQVMARIASASARARVKTWGWLSALAAGAVTISMGLILTALFSGQGVPVLLQKAAAAFGGYLHDAANFAVKGLKILVLAGKIVGDIAGQVLNALRAVTDMIGPETQAVLAGGTLLILVTGGLFLRRRIVFAGRHHEN